MIHTNAKEIRTFCNLHREGRFPELEEKIFTSKDPIITIGRTYDERKQKWYDYFKAWRKRKRETALRIRVRHDILLSVVSAYNSKEYDQVERNNRINQLYRHSALNKDDYLKLKSDYNYSYEINVNKDWQVTIKNR